LAERYLSYAKVNLYLAVLGEYPDGYHRIDTVLQAVSLADRLTFERLPDGRLEVTTDAAGVPSGSGNLVWKALQRLQAAHAVGQGMRVHIEKRIPAQAGLGGGSSNAACGLAVANRLWGLGLSAPELEQLAAGLGADVPFFVRGGAQRCEGRGEILTPLEPLPDATLVIVKPPWGLDTASVYRAHSAGLTSKYAATRMVLDGLAKRDRAGVSRSTFNDLESAAQCLRPDAGMIKAWMTDAGLAGVILSGSGSAWFGFCPGAREAARVQAAARERECEVFLAHPVKGGWIEAEE
jgi:4-diphosphocytidyl-2-C-methyl-D-erythritol kinase